MAATLLELVSAAQKYADRLEGSDHDKAALKRNLDLIAARGATASLAAAITAAVDDIPAIPESVIDKTDPAEWASLVTTFAIQNRDGQRTTAFGGPLAPDFEQGAITAERFVAEGLNRGGPGQPE